MDAFARAAAEGFEERMRAHLEKFFPERCAALGDDAVRELIRAGVAAARNYAIVAERDVARYIDLAVMLRVGPDLALERRWAREILNGTEIPTTKVDRLYAAARPELS